MELVDETRDIADMDVAGRGGDEVQAILGY